MPVLSLVENTVIKQSIGFLSQVPKVPCKCHEYYLHLHWPKPACVRDDDKTTVLMYSYSSHTKSR